MLKNYSRIVGVFLICLILIGSTVSIKAGEDDQDTVAIKTEVEEYELETITVTAEKQQENVQEVPMSITTFNGLDIQDKKIESVPEIADYVPNFMIFDTGMSSFVSQPTMRSITAAGMSFSTTTGLYVDGVPTLSSFGFEDGLADIERVEVLRGPQGTLYGKNTEAGVINIITRQPDNEFSGKVSVEGGEDGKRQTLFNVSGPIETDKFYFGVAGRYYQKDGFIENTVTGDDVDDKERLFGKIRFRYTPTKNLDISLITSHLSRDNGGSNMNLTEAGAAMYGLSTPQEHEVSSNLDEYNETDSDTQSLKIAYSINDFLTLTSITTHKIDSLETAYDLDYSSTTLMHSFQDIETDKFSQELRLDSSSGKMKWLIGSYYDKDQREFNQTTDSIIPSMVSAKDRDFNGDSWAAFGQISYPFTKKVDLIGGLRYEVQDMEFENYILGTSGDDSWDEISPKIAIEYQIRPEFMTYASISKGYRSGGFNMVAEESEYQSYDAENLWSYEVGMKKSFLNNRIIINGSVYYMDITDVQVEETVSPTISYITNAAEATGEGGELEMTARVTDSLDLMAGFGYCDVEFDKFKDVDGNYKGNQNPYAPEYTFNIGTQYRHPNGFYTRMDLLGYGKMYFDKANKYSRDAYEIVNTKIGYETEWFDVYLYGKNIFNEEYDSDGYYGGYYTVYSEPGEIGLGFGYRF